MSEPTCRDKQCLAFVDNGDGTFSQQVTLTSGGPSSTDVPIMQCLEDSSGTTFFATYLVSPDDGSLSTTPIYTDATGAAYTPVGAITKPVDAVDSEVKLFCDEGNGDEKFFKLIIFDGDGNVSSITDVDLGGNPYTATGPVELCLPQEAPACALTEIFVIDSTDAVNGVEEFEWTTSAVTFDSDPNDEQNYVASAAFRVVDGCGQLQHENAPDVSRIVPGPITTNIANGADPDQHELNYYVYLKEDTPLAAHVRGNSAGITYISGCYGKLSKVFDGGRPFGTNLSQIFPIGTYKAGLYKVRQLNHDPTDNGQTGLYWDEAGDGNFSLISSSEVFTTPPTIETKKVWISKGEQRYYELDGTEFIPTATQEVTCIDPCGQDVKGLEETAPQCSLEKLYVIDTTGANGATEEFWEGLDATDPGTVPIEQAFVEVDECGVLKHENDIVTSTTVLTVDGVRSTDPTEAGVNHQSRVEGYLVIPSPGKYLEFAGSGAASRALYTAPCGSKLKPVTSAVGSGTEEVGFYNAGIYHFVFFNHDDGTIGNARLRWRDIGGSFSDIPVENIFVEAPPVTQHVVWVEKGNTLATDQTGIQYDLSDESIFLCDPCDNQIPVTNQIGSIGSGKATIVGTEVISIGGGDPDSDTLTVPGGANGAILQVQLKDKVSDASNCVRYYSNGETATATRGFLAGHKEEIYLGCAGSNGANHTDPLSELEDMNIHIGEAAAGAELEVTYYAF